MRLPKEHREALNAEIDEILAFSHDDVHIAALLLGEELERWEGGGIGFAGTIRQACMVVGLKQMVRNRVRARRVAVRSVAMPATYTVDGAAAPWMNVSVGQLDHVIHRLSSQAHTLNEHAGVLTEAKELAAKHNVDTPAEAFAAEGVQVVAS